MRMLAIEVRFAEGRFHGRAPDSASEWPPSPARLFQALVAGVAVGTNLSEGTTPALEWFESLAPPVTASPPARMAVGFTNYVPNNDADSNQAKKAAKLIRPQLFDAAIPLLYLWSFEPTPEAEAHAANLCAIAERLYQLGRGVDMAWAVGEVLDAEEGEARLAMHRGPIHRPTLAAGGTVRSCPTPGALASLVACHKANAMRFSEVREERNPTQQRLFIFAPHALEHTTPIGREKEHWREMVGAMEGLITLRAGKAGVLVLELIRIDADDIVTRPAQSWKTLTPYTVNRHLRRASVEETLLADIRASCLRLGLPAPAIEVRPLKGQSGVTGDAKLMFPVAVHGPILIGKTRHFGGGFFCPHDARATRR